MEVGNGLAYIFRIHVRDELLEGAESVASLVGLASILHNVVSVGAFNVVVASPHTSFFREVNVAAYSAGGIESQRLPCSIFSSAKHFPCDMACYMFYIAHHLHRIFKDVVINALQNITIYMSVIRAVACPVGCIDMTVT